MEKASSTETVTRHQATSLNPGPAVTLRRTIGVASISNAPFSSRTSDMNRLIDPAQRNDPAYVNVGRFALSQDMDRYTSQASSPTSNATNPQASIKKASSDEVPSSPARGQAPGLNTPIGAEAARILPDTSESSPVSVTTRQTLACQPGTTLGQVIRKLRNPVTNVDPATALWRLETLNKKNINGEFEFGQKVQNMMDFASVVPRPWGVALNVIYLSVLRALAQTAGAQGASMVARLLRSPDSDKSWFMKSISPMRPGYYQTVLIHGEDVPQLTRALKSLVDDLAKQSLQGPATRLILKMQNELRKRHASEAIADWPRASFTDIQQALKDIQLQA